MSGKKGQKKRFWSDDEKISICGQTCASGVSVAQVARRYSMNANLIHKWLRDPCFAPDDRRADGVVVEETSFLPVEIEGVASSVSLTHPPLSTLDVTNPLSAHRVDIALSDGRRILVEGTTALSAVLSLVEGLAT